MKKICKKNPRIQLGYKKPLFLFVFFSAALLFSTMTQNLLKTFEKMCTKNLNWQFATYRSSRESYLSRFCIAALIRCLLSADWQVYCNCSKQLHQSYPQWYFFAISTEIKLEQNTFWLEVKMLDTIYKSFHWLHQIYR